MDGLHDPQSPRDQVVQLRSRVENMLKEATGIQTDLNEMRADLEEGRPALKDHKKRTMELRERSMSPAKTPLAYRPSRGAAVTVTEWEQHLSQESGRIQHALGLRQKIFAGGITPAARKYIWPFLLGVYEWDTSTMQRNALREEQQALLERTLAAAAEEQEQNSEFADHKNAIDKDVIRTDRKQPLFASTESPHSEQMRQILYSYAMLHPEPGYCQGMSDMLSPIVAVMDDPVDSFMCFCSLMERMGTNFSKNQVGAQNQLRKLNKLVKQYDHRFWRFLEGQNALDFYFCFRWILILFKREFPFDQVAQLWEVFWSCEVNADFHLYFCMAILARHRNQMMEAVLGFDDILKYINTLSGKLQMSMLLRDAEEIYTRLSSRSPV